MNTSGEICIPIFDQQRLLVLIQKMTAAELTSEQKQLLELLQLRLNSAQICPREKVTRDLITMNSKVCIKDLETNVKAFPIICFPEDANEKYHKLSILSPLAINLLGSRVGQQITVKQSYRLHHFSIEAIIFQPEAAGINV
jgi:regulator of nucleoside diphosphate kinase